MKTYHVCHILVSAEYEAQDILKKLNEGAAFEKLASQFSICSSASNGGDLGQIKIGKADPDFEEAALRLTVGQTGSKPVRTRFGYHLIKRLK